VKGVFPHKSQASAPYLCGLTRAGIEETRHHALQLRVWSALEAFASRVSVGEFQEADEPSLLAALDAHLTTTLFPSPADASARQWWHPLVVKADLNSTRPGVAHKATSGALAQSIVVLDVGVVVEGLEIDCGLSVGFTPRAQSLAMASCELTQGVISYIQSHAALCSPASVYNELLRQANARGLTQLDVSAGHRTGPYPTPKRETKIRADDSAARFEPGCWMVEVHVTDAAGDIAAFYEDCVYVGPA